MIIAEYFFSFLQTKTYCDASTELSQYAGFNPTALRMAKIEAILAFLSAIGLIRGHNLILHGDLSRIISTYPKIIPPILNSEFKHSIFERDRVPCLWKQQSKSLLQFMRKGLYRQRAIFSNTGHLGY